MSRYLSITLVDQLGRQLVARLNTTLRRIYIQSGVEALAMEEQASFELAMEQQASFEFAVKTKAIFAMSFTFVLNPA